MVMFVEVLWNEGCGVCIGYRNVGGSELFLVLAGVYRQIYDVVEGLQLAAGLRDLPLLPKHSYHFTHRLELTVTE